MSIVGVLGIALLLLGGFILYRAQVADNGIDFADLLKDGPHTSLRKVGELVALLCSTWLVVYLVVHDKLNEGYFSVYLGCWVARTLLGQLTQAKAAQMADSK